MSANSQIRTSVSKRTDCVTQMMDEAGADPSKIGTSLVDKMERQYAGMGKLQLVAAASSDPARQDTLDGDD